MPSPSSHRRVSIELQQTEQSNDWWVLRRQLKGLDVISPATLWEPRPIVRGFLKRVPLAWQSSGIRHMKMHVVYHRNAELDKIVRKIARHSLFVFPVWARKSVQTSSV